VQELNLKRKQEQKEKHKDRSMKGMPKNDEQEEIVDDDVAYYKSEVGHAPNEGTLLFFFFRKCLL
jgi:hypothetical protein